MEVLDHEFGAFSISTRCRLKWKVEEWVFVGVYNPTVRSEVDNFLQELDDVKACWELPWCIGGDFNLIRFSLERSGGVWNDYGISKFGDFINR